MVVLVPRPAGDRETDWTVDAVEGSKRVAHAADDDVVHVIKRRWRVGRRLSVISTFFIATRVRVRVSVVPSYADAAQDKVKNREA